MKFIPALAAALVVVATTTTTTAFAQAPSSAASGAPPAAAAPTTEGEVRKIDKAQGKLTLRHGPIASLEMPAMTMVFRVADAKMLDTLQVGDKVRFAAEKSAGGAITVTRIEAAK